LPGALTFDYLRHLPEGGDFMTELDPAVAAFLADFALAPSTPLAQTTPPLFRSEAYQWKKYQGEPVEVDQVIHEFLTTPTADIPVRIYIPKTTSTKPLRALIFLHGSGWTSNNIELADTPHRLLAHLTETIVIAPNYQKSPEHRFPIPLQDSLATLAWVQENAERFGVDPTRIGIGGDSAGGNLAAAVSLFTIDNGLAAPAFQILLYPVLDVFNEYQSATTYASGYLLEWEAMDWFINNYLGENGDRSHPYVSPYLSGSIKNLPPTLIQTAEYDPLRDQGSAFAEKAADLGVNVKYTCFPGQVHAYLWMAGWVSQTHKSVLEIKEWLDLNHF